MPKSDLAIAGEYAPVAARITLFYERYPEGCILTELVARTDRAITFKATVYRAPDDALPAATGWASEQPGDGDVNAVACLENTETSAVGRALANLGFTAARQRPSAEEMQKAARARARLARDGDAMRALERDLLRLVAIAERAGVRPLRAAAWRERLLAGGHDRRWLEDAERRLRAWVLRQRR